MRAIGKIIQFDGRYGIIVDQDEEVEFQIQDVLYSPVQVGDLVFFRKERREPDLILARYISIYQKEKGENDNVPR